MRIESSTALEGKSHRFVLSATTGEKVLHTADNILTELGYTVKESYNNGKSYSKGSRVLRMLLGAFYKYNQVSANIAVSDHAITLTVNNESSGISGGLIGMNQGKKEFNTIVTEFEQKLGSSLY
jgi:hypothetical protein